MFNLTLILQKVEKLVQRRVLGMKRTGEKGENKSTGKEKYKGTLF